MNSLLSNTDLSRSIIDTWYKYLLKSVLQHHKLFSFCLTTNRSVEERQKSVAIETIEDLPPLHQSTKAATLSYNLALQKIEDSELDKLAAIQQRQLATMVELGREEAQLGEIISTGGHSYEVSLLIVLLSVVIVANLYPATAAVD